MGKGCELAVSALALTACATALRSQAFTCNSGVIQNHSLRHHSRKRICDKVSRQSGIRDYPLTVVMMVSEREEELKAKIAKLRGAASKGDSYERVVGKGQELTEKMKKSKGEFDGEIARAEQEKLRDAVVVKGNKDDAVSELEAGRRTIVRDPDDPRLESNILDNLMVSREEDIEDELRAAYMPGSSSVDVERKEKTFDGAYATTMLGAEEFFKKTSPFQKVAQEKAQEAVKAAAAYKARTKNATDAEASGGGTAVEETVTDPEVEEASLRVTGSVGGRWEKPEEGIEVDTHKPVVSTWGVFERPKDMSKAFGGGRDPTLKKLDAEESRRREEETQAILRSYRGSVGEDLDRELKSEDVIQAALAQSKRAMRFGDTFGAVSALEGVKQECSTHGPLGAVVFLELAMALEATGRSYQAQDIYKVLRRSRNREVRAQAKRLNEGLEAMDMLNFGRPGEVDEESEISKMWTTNYQQLSTKDNKRYDSAYFEKDLDGIPKGANVFDVEDAKQVLMFACKYNGGVSSKRIINAFEFLKKRSDEAALAAQREAAELRRKAQKMSADAGAEEDDENMPGEEDAGDISAETSELLRRRRARLSNTDQAKNDFPKGGAGLVSLMGDLSSLETRIQGSWNLVMKAGGSKVEVIARDASLLLAPGGAVKAVEPAGPLSIAKEGQWELDSSQRVVKLDYRSSKWIGLVDIGGGQEDLEVLALDDQLLVASEAGLSKAGTVRPQAVKYRLLVRQ